MTAPRIKAVQPLEGKVLRVEFVNGINKIYDCKRLFHLDAFRPLHSEAFFRAVKVDTGGYGISWNDDADLSEYELWVNGQASE
jgi:hypothetical protein